MAVVILGAGGCGKRNQTNAAKKPEDLVADLTGSGNEQVRLTAARKLATVHTTQAVTALAKALDDASSGVQLAAANSLSNATYDAAIADALFEGVQDRMRPNQFRLAAASAMANMGDARAAGFLIESMRRYRKEATAGLAKLGAKAVPPLIVALGDAGTRPDATVMLMGMGAPATEPLIDAMQKAPSKYARLAAATALAEISSPAAIKCLSDAVRTGNAEFHAATYRFLIRRGEMQDQLVDALRQFGRPNMARDFIQCGNPGLKSEAESWALNNNVLVPKEPSEAGVVHWGEWGPK